MFHCEQNNFRNIPSYFIMLLLILRRRQINQLLKRAIEMSNRIEATFHSYLRNIHLSQC